MRRLPLLALLVAGCATPSTTPEPDVDEEVAARTACDIAGETPTALVAAAERMEEPPAESVAVIGAGPYVIELQESGHSWVSFAAGGDDNAAVAFLGVADAVEDFWETDHRHAQTNPTPNEGCPELIPEQHLLELHAGQWYVEIGVIPEDSVWFYLDTGLTPQE